MNRILSVILILFFTNITINGYSQNKHKHEPKHYTDTAGVLYWNKKLPFYLRISTNPDEKGLLLKGEVDEHTNPTYFDTEGKNVVRTVWAVDNKTQKKVYPQVEVRWNIEVDGITPNSTIDFVEAPHYYHDGTHYYGRELVLNITTKDNLSGIEKLYYSLDEEAFKDYSQKIPFSTEGKHIIKFYAVDNVGNDEDITSKEFIVDVTNPKTYYNITGIAKDKVISTATKIYLDPTDSISGVKKTYYQIDDGKEQLYTVNQIIPIKNLEDGNHKLTFYSIDNVDNVEEKTVVEFYLDRTAPIMAADIIGDRYLIGNDVFFSGRTKMKLTAVDNKAGVKDILYSIDGGEFKSYDQPFYLPGVPGTHEVKYFAIDNMENTSNKDGKDYYEKYKHVVSRVYVDLSGPLMSHSFIGDIVETRDTTFINKYTKIKFKATDKESGLQFITYSIDENPDEERYNEPFNFEKQGLHKIVYYAYDNVNNRNRKDFFVFLDDEGPEIIYNFSIKSIGEEQNLPKYPSYTLLYLAAEDKVIGTKDIYYSLNGANERKYQEYIKGFKPNMINTVHIRAVDKLKNSTKKQIKIYIGD